jgi:hypothetical protein
MTREALTAKAKGYLDKHGYAYRPETLRYFGLHPEVPQRDGSTKPMHIILYHSPFSDKLPESHSGHYAVYIDAATNKLAFILGAQTLHRIKDE